jgi:hypothetical protein
MFMIFLEAPCWNRLYIRVDAHGQLQGFDSPGESEAGSTPADNERAKLPGGLVM